MKGNTVTQPLKPITPGKLFLSLPEVTLTLSLYERVIEQAKQIQDPDYRFFTSYCLNSSKTELHSLIFGPYPTDWEKHDWLGQLPILIRVFQELSNASLVCNLYLSLKKPSKEEEKKILEIL
ncbi:MAG: hypothetical protein ACK4GE_06475, partial [Caldimicrobium sp.]